MKSSITEAAVRQSIRVHCYSNETRSSTVSVVAGSNDSKALVSEKKRWIRFIKKKHSTSQDDFLKPFSVVLLTVTQLPQASLHRMVTSFPLVSCKQVEQLCNLSHIHPQVWLVIQYDVSTWQQFVSLCGFCVEKKQAAFSPVATVPGERKTKGAEIISVLTHQLICRQRVCPAKVNKTLAYNTGIRLGL